MALRLRLRYALPLTSSLLHRLSATPPLISSTPNLLLPSSTPPPFRPFTSTTTTFLSSRFQSSYNNNNNDEIGPDTILFEGCDYNHFLIVVDFPKDPKPSSQEMVDFYEETASKVFGSMEDAKKKIYACSTTTYTGFQVECSEETSEKFKDLPGVIFVLPDSYIDPVNKEYGGDKYINGQIIPRPPPIQHGRSNNREFRSRPSRRGPMEGENRNYGPPVTPQQNFNSPPPPHRSMEGENRNYYPPATHQQNFNSPPPPQRNMDGEYRNYSPPVTPQQNFSTPPPAQRSPSPPRLQQNFGPSPPQQNYGPPHPQQQYGPQSNFPQHQNYGPPPPQNYGPPPPQNFGPPPQQSYSQPGLGERRGPLPPTNAPGGLDTSQGARRDHMPSDQMQYSQGERGNFYPRGQSNFGEGNRGSYGTEKRGLSGPSSQGGYDVQASPTAQGRETGPGYTTQYNQSR